MRLVLIEWIDACGCNSDWKLLEEYHPKPLLCRSVGWLFRDNEECKVIVPYLSESEAPAQGCGDMTIPTASVVRMIDLTVPT